MRRRRAWALLAFFLMTTAALAPVAFQFGKALGARAPASEDRKTSYFGPYETVDRGALARDCPELGQPGAIARGYAVIDCREGGRGGGARALLRDRLANNKSEDNAGPASTNVRDRLVQRIAGAQAAGAGDPIHLAGVDAGAGRLTAPSATGGAAPPNGPAGAGSALGIAGPGGGFSGSSPTIPGGGGLPLILSPALLTAIGPDPIDPGDIFGPGDGAGPGADSDLVTPLPAGAPLFLTGALILAARRRKSAQRAGQ